MRQSEEIAFVTAELFELAVGFTELVFDWGKILERALVTTGSGFSGRL